MVALQRYPWPGNVRELVNVIERSRLVLRSRDDRCLGSARLRAPAKIRAADARRAARAQARAIDPRRVEPARRTTAADARGAAVVEGVTFELPKERWVATFERDYILQTAAAKHAAIFLTPRATLTSIANTSAR